MSAAIVSVDLFPRLSLHGKTKLVIVGASPSSEDLSRFRSLNLEHVSPAVLIQPEISRRTPLGQKAERAAEQGRPLSDPDLFAVMRRWFWARKPDAGFLLEGFPATLLQAKVFDEWLDARDESLDGVHVGAAAVSAVSEHYRTLGLLIGAESPSFR